MKSFFLYVMLSFPAGACFAQSVIKDPNVVKRDVAGFHAIHVSSSIDLFLSQGEEDAVAVSASESRFVDYIRTDVKDGVLTIYYTNTGRGFSIGNRKLRAYVSVKNLDKLEAVGASDVLVNGTLTTPALDLQLSGASDFKGAVDAGSLKVNISGASDIHIRGKANTLYVDASGASDFKGYDLVSETCDVKASGASDIRVNCNRESNADASGASDIHIRGNGVIRSMHSSGASSVKKV